MLSYLYLESGSVAGVEDLPLHLVGCDEDLLQARVIQQLGWDKVYWTLPQTLQMLQMSSLSFACLTQTTPCHT